MNNEQRNIPFSNRKKAEDTTLLNGRMDTVESELAEKVNSSNITDVRDNADVLEYSLDEGTTWKQVQGSGGSGTSFFINIKDKGAVGDGVTNDTTAIQSALDEANASGGGTVFVPVGTYLTDTLIVYSNTTILGENKNKSVLKLLDSPTGALLECSGTTTTLKENINIIRLSLKHLSSFNRTDEVVGSLIKGYYTAFCSVKDCFLSDCSVNGIILNNVDNDATLARSWVIDGCIFANFRKINNCNAIHLYVQSEYVQISNCIFHTVSRAIYSNSSANIRIVNNTFLNCGYKYSTVVLIPVIDIALSGTNSGKVQIIGNAINHNAYIAIKITGIDTVNVEKGNEIIGNDILVSAYTPIQISGSQGNVISGNKIGGGSGVTPIVLEDANGFSADYNIINNNILQFGSISNTSTGTNNVISNNIENAPS